MDFSIQEMNSGDSSYPHLSFVSSLVNLVRFAHKRHFAVNRLQWSAGISCLTHQGQEEQILGRRRKWSIHSRAIFCTSTGISLGKCHVEQVLTSHFRLSIHTFSSTRGGGQKVQGELKHFLLAVFGTDIFNFLNLSILSLFCCWLFLILKCPNPSCIWFIMRFVH